jgi:hypothetical protein
VTFDIAAARQWANEPANIDAGPFSLVPQVNRLRFALRAACDALEAERATTATLRKALAFYSTMNLNTTNDYLRQDCGDIARAALADTEKPMSDEIRDSYLDDPHDSEIGPWPYVCLKCRQKQHCNGTLAICECDCGEDR